VTEYFKELTKAIRHLYCHEAEYIRTVPIKEVFEGKTIWDGEVEIFILRNYKAKRCYAWGHRKDGGGWKITTVLELPPVVSARTAVKAAIMAKAKETVT
jgi:hypothetical protein